MERIFFITVLVALSLVFCGCNQPQKTPKQKPKDLNITILLDLSNRINTSRNPEQWKYDTTNIKVIIEVFKSKIKNEPHLCRGKIRVQLLPPPSEGLNMNAIVSGLKFNCPGEAVKNKEIHDTIAKRYAQNLQEIYTQTIKASNWQGRSDIWGFFQDEVDRCIEKDTSYRNILVIFTDGYLRYDGRLDLKTVNTTSIQPDRIKKYRTPNWRVCIDNDNFSIDPCHDNLHNLEILVLEIKAEDPFVDEENILIYLWEKWLKKMGVQKYKLLKSALPSDRKTDIEIFLNSK